MTRFYVSLEKQQCSVRNKLSVLPPSPHSLPPCLQPHLPPHLPSCPRRKITPLPQGTITHLGSGSGPSHLLKGFSPPITLPPLNDQVLPLMGCFHLYLNTLWCLHITKSFRDFISPSSYQPPSLSTSAGRLPGEAHGYHSLTPFLPFTLISMGSPRH